MTESQADSFLLSHKMFLASYYLTQCTSSRPDLLINRDTWTKVELFPLKIKKRERKKVMAIRGIGWLRGLLIG